MTISTQLLNLMNGAIAAAKVQGCICDPAPDGEISEYKEGGGVFMVTLKHDDWCPLAHLEEGT